MLSSKNICVITPTKGRHKLLKSMLESLSNQTCRVGQVIIADGGRDAEHIINEFKDKLSIEWLDCPVAGQILQRNLALKKVKDDIKVIIYFDDDIVQERDAIANLIDFWNSRENAPAGVSFNLSGIEKQKNSFIRKFFFMQLEPKGKILYSGYNTPITEIKEDLKSDWLLGGATAWRRDILERTSHLNISTTWATCEDIIFSYPVSKTEELYVCAAAKVKDIDTVRDFTFSQMRFRGRKAVLWRYYFVTCHKELLTGMFIWMVFGQTITRLLIGLSGNKSMLGHGLGHAEGLMKCVFNLISQNDPKNIIE